MGAKARDIIGAILTALRVDHSALGGTYDLRTSLGQARVVWDDGALFPPVVPFVTLGGLELRTNYEDGASLGEYGVRGRMTWFGFVQGDLTPDDRAFAALDLANDVISAIQRAHADPNNELGQLVRCLVSLEDVFGDGSDQLQGYGVAWGMIEFTRTSVLGV